MYASGPSVAQMSIPPVPARMSADLAMPVTARLTAADGSRQFGKMPELILKHGE